MLVGVGRMIIGVGIVVSIGCGVLGLPSLGGVFAELDITVDLAQIFCVVVRGTGAAATRSRALLVLCAPSEEVPQDETEHGDEQDDERPNGFGQDSDQTTIAQKAIEESVQCHCCCQNNRGNEESSHTQRIVHKPEQ